MSLFEELRRRNVFRVGIAYVVTAWLILQVADIVLDNTSAPEWVMHVIMLLLAIGLPLALLFAWAFELTPEGLKKERDVDRSRSITPSTGRRLNLVTSVILAAALAYFVWDKFGGSDTEKTGSGSNPISAQEPAVKNAAQGPLDQPPVPDDTAVAAPEKSIAVLPFVNMSNDPDQEFFSDGISEELLNVLARYPGVRVAARTSSFQFKGQNLDIGEIARLLKVKHVLEGSVRKSGNKLRITAQLIQADSGYHLWSETYDRELDDIFAIQDEISAAIGEALRVELALDGEQTPASLPRVAESANTAAYEAFLRGRHLVNQRGRSNITQAVEDLKRAVRLDPEFAPAHAWMAIAWIMMLNSPSTYGDLTLAEVRQRAVPHIEKALAVDPSLAEAHGAQALLAMNSGDFEAAMSATTRALELNPVYVDAMNWRQIAAGNFGDYQTSQDILRRIIEVDPLSIVGRLNYALVLASTDLEAARTMGHSLVEQNPWAGYTSLGLIEYFAGDGLAASLGWYLRAYGQDPHDELSNRALIQILSQAGLFEEARRISDGNLHIVDVAENRLESAIYSLQLAHTGDPENLALLTDLADALHLAGRFDESQRYYDQLRHRSPLNAVFDTVYASTMPTVRMAYAFKLAGDTEAARQALAIHRLDVEKRQKLKTTAFSDHLAEAAARSVEDNASGVFESIQAAIDAGARDQAFFREPALQWLQGHPEFLALKAQMQQRVDIERAGIVRLICQQNPIPEIWQPLRQTCDGIEAGS